MTALLPCPFCGNSPTPNHYAGGQNSMPFGEVGCRTCGFEIMHGSAEDAEKAWNRRAPVTIDDAMVERAWNIATLGFPDVGVCAISKDAMRAALEAAIGVKS